MLFGILLVPCQQMLGSNSPGLGAVMYVDAILEMPSMNVRKHPLSFPMRFSGLIMSHEETWDISVWTTLQEFLLPYWMTT